MRARTPILIVLTCSMLATVTTTAGASSHRRGYSVPECKEFVTTREAATFMGEDKAYVVRAQHNGGFTRDCIWFGGSQGEHEPGHALEVVYGEYADFLVSPYMNRKVICSLSKPACEHHGMALKAKSKQASFAHVAELFGRLGIAKRLLPTAFDGNPAFIWDSGEKLVPYLDGRETRVFVYLADTKRLLQVACVDHEASGDTYDHPCAIAAAKRAYDNSPS